MRLCKQSHVGGTNTMWASLNAYPMPTVHTKVCQGPCKTRRMVLKNG